MIFLVHRVPRDCRSILKKMITSAVEVIAYKIKEVVKELPKVLRRKIDKFLIGRMTQDIIDQMKQEEEGVVQETLKLEIIRTTGDIKAVIK